MENSSFDWIAWQKAVIKEEYKDIIPARDNTEKQFQKTVKASLKAVKRDDH